MELALIMSAMSRKIIHIDADAFYASVEIREHPEWADLPLAVGGSPQGRGVIATCNYAARRYGVHSAMPASRALRLCPDLHIVKPRFDLYKTVSRQIQAIFRDFTDVIEPVSLDEAYLDVSACRQHQGSATRIAESIRLRVRQETGVTVSAGVAPNKFLAKVASDWNKPDGLFVITPDNVSRFVQTLPVKKINGVGQVTAEKLARLGVDTCGDLQALTEAELVRLFGRYGPRLYRYARGEDDRPVKTERVRKSLSCERTYAEDLQDWPDILEAAPPLYEELQQRLQRLPEDAHQPSGRLVKVRFGDFRSTTLEQVLTPGSRIPGEDFELFLGMLESAWKRQGKAVRLLGMGYRLKPSHLPEQLGPQLSLF